MKPDTTKASQLLLNFYKSGAQENTPRLITTITPTRDFYPMAQGRKLINDAREAAKNHDREVQFLERGIKAVLRTDEEILEVAHALALFKYSREQHFIADMFTGLYTMLTRGERFLDVQQVMAKNIITGKEELSSVRIFTTIPTLYKAALGPLVDGNARSLNGTYEIVHYAKKFIDPVINGRAPTPRASASLKDVQREDGSRGDVWISGEPLRIHRLARTRNTGDYVAVDLDCDFAPVKFEGDKILADDQFIHNVAGLTAMLQLGKRNSDKDEGKGINSITAKQIILTFQTGIEIGRITGLGVRKNNSGRINITVRRNALPGMFPDAIQDIGKPTERPNYREISNQVGKAGEYFYRALEMTDILEELEGYKTPIYIPALDRGVEFPNGIHYKNAVYFKADRLRG
jgi:hypothetical protein